ncbi:MAG: type IX secretion system sortase PorU [Muribaculaceae bacterium]
MKHIVLAFIALLATINTSMAFDTAFYAANSKLASGKWVKIAIPENGVYEITNDELIQFGFSNPAKVRLFGYGGTAIPEELKASNSIDDVVQLPILRTSNKICFYGRSAKDIYLLGAASSAPRYVPSLNPYSTKGYYFLTDDSKYQELLIDVISNPNNGVYNISESFDYAYHEKEEMSLSSTGKQFLGEDFTAERSISIPMEMPNFVEGSQLIVNVAVALSATSDGRITTSINGENVTFVNNNDIIRAASSHYVYFNSSSPYVYFTPKLSPVKANVKIGVDCSGVVKSIKNDYIIFTYKRHNTLLNGINQQRMGFSHISVYDKIVITDADANTVLWNINDAQNPHQYALESKSNNDGSFQASCSTQKSAAWTQFIAFNPSRQLLKVENAGEVINQDLHGMAVPDMVIITTHDFLPIAQKLADYHKTADALDVAVVDQNSIFNEFSSGTPDATAYRKFAKMLWDKDPIKFKYLLLFGGGSYDNRKLIGNKGDNLLLTYQSDASNDESMSFTTDDYFAFLSDNSGGNIIHENVNIAVGRMPVTNVQEADNAVSKLINYMKNSSYENWRNNMLIICDKGDEGLHMYQGEGVEKLVNETLSLNMQVNKVYSEAFPLINNYADVAREKIHRFIVDGQLLVTYVGHGSPIALSQTIGLWRKEDVKSAKTSNIPLFSLATCDVARFDSDTRGIAEDMFHASNGGAIACMASARSVSATENDKLNRAFISALLTKNSDGSYSSIGAANMKSKLVFAEPNLNKLNFILFGDPAMKLIYPKSTIKINTINDISPELAAISPMSEVVIKGSVLNEDGTMNANFNGPITASLYDKKVYFKDVNLSFGDGVRSIYFQNDALNQSSATVVNGAFSVKMIVPRNCFASDEKVTLRLFAHDVATNDIVNCSNQNIIMKKFDQSTAIIDTQAPEITAMYINNDKFCDGDVFDSSDNQIYVYFNDNVAINTKSTIGEAMRLTLDKNITFPDITNYYSSISSEKTGRISYPLKDLTFGHHTLDFSINDLAGNNATSSISFYILPPNPASTLDVEESPAREKATFILNHEYNSATPEVTIKVFDANNNLVWTKATTSFPHEWNLTDIKGNRIGEGIYTFNAIIKSNNQYGHTDTKKIVVIKQ